MAAVRLSWKASAPGDALEYSASAGAAAFIFGAEDLLAVCEHTHSFMTDTPDFWRREYQFYPRHAGRFTGEPAYFRHVLSCARTLMEKARLTPEDFRWAVFHQPNGKFPMAAAKELGFPKEKVEQGWLSPTLGNTYSGSSPMGLTAILDAGYLPGNKGQGYALRRLLRTLWRLGATLDHPVFHAERRRQERLRERYRRLAPKHAGMTTAWWFDTHGIVVSDFDEATAVGSGMRRG